MDQTAGLTNAMEIAENEAAIAKQKKIAREKFIVYLAMHSLDNEKCGKLKSDLHNGFTLGKKDIHLKTMEDAIQIVMNHGHKNRTKRNNNQLNQMVDQNLAGVAFANKGFPANNSNNKPNFFFSFFPFFLIFFLRQ